MENEWLDLSYINDKIILHGQIVNVEVDTYESTRDLLFRHRRELLRLMKSYVVSIQTRAATKHDDLDYVVDFEKPDGQFQNLLRSIEALEKGCGSFENC